MVPVSLPLNVRGIRVETFIVRIYQRDSDDPSKFTGAVEIPGVRMLVPFDSQNSLQLILSTSISKEGRNDGRIDEH